ncbi:hypothetical protein CTAYLR_004336 [Chrysophaeum taylorii]|uniref:Uncharacterized protein n=1 Tax=Chrysophaeum taylorii TaxID=2483200 RepID=A0AAD7UFR4_9STRA|nr:hypothetical protein CTAYLR_004336 [Chrysophaeum taylorii]
MVGLSLAAKCLDGLREAYYGSKTRLQHRKQRASVPLALEIQLDGAVVQLRAGAGDSLYAVAEAFVGEYLNDDFSGANCDRGDRGCMTEVVYHKLLEVADADETCAPVVVVVVVVFVVTLLLLLVRLGMKQRLRVRADEAVRAARKADMRAVIKEQRLRVRAENAARTALKADMQAVIDAQRARVQADDVVRAALKADMTVVIEEQRQRIRELEQHQTRSTTTTIPSTDAVIEEQRQRIRELERHQTMSPSADVEALREQNETLKGQLRQAGLMVVEEVVSYEDAKERLRKATLRVLESDSPAAERELCKWDVFVGCHPRHLEEQLANQAAWHRENSAANALCRRVVAGFVPPEVMARGASKKALRLAGLEPAAVKRVFETPALWLTRAPPTLVARVHVADLRSRYQVSQLTLLELRAVYASLPKDFEADPNGDKSQWRASVETKLRDMVRSSETLPPAKRAPRCFGEPAKWAIEATQADEVPTLIPDHIQLALPFSSSVDREPAAQPPKLVSPPRPSPTNKPATLSTPPKRPALKGMAGILAKVRERRPRDDNAENATPPRGDKGQPVSTPPRKKTPLAPRVP